MTTDENDVRAMLSRHAGDVTPSPDAWERIQAKIADDERPTALVRRHPFRVMAGGAAAAAVAALVVGQVLPGSPTTQVATPTTETTALTVPETGARPDFPFVYPDPTISAAPPDDPVEAAVRYLQARTGVVPGEARVISQERDSAQLRFDEGPVYSEVFLRRYGGAWYVDSSTSDLFMLYPSYTGSQVGGDAGVEADGELTLSWRGADDDRAHTETQRVERLAMPLLERSMPGELYVVVGGVLAMDDGTFAVAESWVQNPETGAVQPGGGEGEGVDSYTGIYPAFTGDELAGYEDMAASGQRPDLEDPQAVAGQFLGERFFPRDTSDVSYEVHEFQQGDALSGEVPFTLSDGSVGQVLVRKASPEARTWYVVAAQTQPDFADVRVEGGGVTIEPFPRVAEVRAELQPMPGGDLVVAEPADELLRIEGVIEGIVRVVGTDADGRTVFRIARIAAAG